MENKKNCFCFRCKQKRECEVSFLKETKTKSKIYTGFCPICGCKVACVSK